jgi:hypothetical protein
MKKQTKKQIIINLVKDILTENEEARDDTNYLYRLYLKAVGKNPKTLTIEKLFVAIRYGKLPKIATIERYSREIQENDISLRGAEWIKRHHIKEKVRKEYSKK